MAVYQIDPLTDPRWTELTNEHLRASVFHTCGWLKSLKERYRYHPIVFTTCSPGQQLTNGVAFCSIESWITGSRLVSLPFSDHCEPLFGKPDELEEMLSGIIQRADQRWDYIELRPLHPETTSILKATDFRPGNTFHFHCLDTRQNLQELLRLSDKGTVQRKIRRAEREGLGYREGRSEELLAEFHRLLVLTRRRHRVPPQPIAWFRNLAGTMGEKLKIRVVSVGDRAIASIISLSHNGTMVYKYGCSDLRYSNLGGTALLFLRMIQDAQSSGCHTLDMGRSDDDNPGLIRFKANWGASDSPLTYWRFPASAATARALEGRKRTVAGHIISHLPDRMFVALGEIVYRHIG